MMQTSRTVGLVFAMTALLWPAFSSGESSSNAKVCGYLPIPELEAHFGAKATALRGNDGTPNQMASCSVDLPDRMHGATLLSGKPDSPGRTVEGHLAAAKPVASQIKTLGSVGCYRPMLGVPATTCLLDGGHYPTLTLVSDDSKKLGFESVKQLLEKAAARRK